MPSSTWVHISTVLDIVWKHQPKSVLDVGAGFGRWGFLTRELLDIFRNRYSKGDWQTVIDGVEIWSRYICHHHKYLYSNIYTTSIEDFFKSNKQSYDVIIAGDVIEHLEKKKALEVINSLRMITDKVLIVCIPLGSGYPQKASKPDKLGLVNKAEEHLSIWEETDFDKLGLTAKLVVKERIKKRPYGIFQLSPLKEVIF